MPVRKGDSETKGKVKKDRSDAKKDLTFVCKCSIIYYRINEKRGKKVSYRNAVLIQETRDMRIEYKGYAILDENGYTLFFMYRGLDYADLLDHRIHPATVTLLK